MLRVQRALLSVYDKTGLDALAAVLRRHNVELISTGRTAEVLPPPVRTVADVTGFPEILGGRVKTLHPKIHGGILARRSEASDLETLSTHGIETIDLVVCNLYPFTDTVAKNGSFADCIENIDIGGPCMIRAAAKNHDSVVVITSPKQYDELAHELDTHNGGTSVEFRRRMAAAAFAHTMTYDSAVSGWFASGAGGTLTASGDQVITRQYVDALKLKYGCNPHQNPASICAIQGSSLPFSVLNGRPGYINLLDAINAWQLVRELREALGLPAAASFKHVSPAGAAVALELTSVEREAFDVGAKDLTPCAVAYVRARNADPLCSFGDFAALSDVVDEATALYLKTAVSDGIIAPGYTPEALAILAAKKNGDFIVLQADASHRPPADEYREIGGAVFKQRRNDVVFSAEAHLANRVTEKKDLPSNGAVDLTVASIAVKYTQSNSIAYAQNGMVVGVGAGQQSRVDCVKLAGRKVDTYFLRQHPKVLGLPFKAEVKRQERVNARVQYIEGDMTAVERAQWLTQFSSEPEPLTTEERVQWMQQVKGVALSSDAFFPFRDSIDQASKRGVEYVVQPGGSAKDDQVIQACNEYGMLMAFSGLRLFHH